MQVIDQLILDENNIAFYPMMGNSYQLNNISKEIITLLKHHKSKDEIIKELSLAYDVSENELFIDVSDFISKLKVYGLV
ncbi:MAG: PqqD family protein [Sulfurimonas sp.]